jgi:hypothetical protein
MIAARKLLDDEDEPISAVPKADEQGVELPSEDEAWFDQMVAEAEEDERLGRFVSLEEIRAKLRRSA